MSFTDDPAVFINDETPGYVLATISGASVDALFDDAYADPFSIAGSSPALTVASADVSSVAQGAAVTVNAVSYTVTAIKPDGTGVTVLLLAET